MFGKKKRSKDYQKMVKARKSKDYLDYYDDYFEGDEIEDDAYYEDDTYYEDDQPDDYDPEGFYEDEYPEDRIAGSDKTGSGEFIDEEEDACEEEEEFADEEEDDYEEEEEFADGEEDACEEEEEFADGEEDAYEEEYADGEEDACEEEEEFADEEDDYEEDDDYGDFDVEGDEDDDYDYEAVDERRKKYAAAPVKHRKKTHKRTHAGSGQHKKLSGVDWVVAFMGICILIVALITGMMYANTRVIAAQVASFSDVGEALDDINIIGESGLLAVGAAQADKLFSDLEEPEEEAQETPEEEEEEDETVAVILKVTSIQSDIKVKFINKASEKLIGGVPFKVHVKGDNSKEYDWEDDDKDGIIYHTEIPNGKYKVRLEALSGSAAERYALPTEEVSVTVTDTIAYKKVDVKEEIKNESQVNAAMEDTAVQNTEVESVLQDTVEWVESTKTPIDSETVYEEVKESEIAKPAAAKAAVKNSYAMALMGAENTSETTGGEKPTMSTGLFDAEIEVGGTIQFSASMSDGSSVSWSSDSECASVDSSGTVTGRSAGTAVITVKSDVTKDTVSCNITVKEKKTEEPVPSAEMTISLDQSKATVKVGDSITIKAAVDNNKDNRSVEWDSSDPSVAKVSGGTVTGVGSGTAVITATVQGTEISASCTVEVTKEDKKDDKKDDKKSISLDASEVTLTVGAEVTVHATTENTGDVVVWSTSDKKIATVSDGKIKGLKEGSATITAALKADSSISASCAVTVTAEEVDQTAALKDTKGNQLYIKKSDGSYREATVADYLKGGFKFYRKMSRDTAYRYTGWQTIDGYTYFFDKNGNYVTGEQVIQGAKYTFGSDGKLSAGSGTLGIDVSKWNGDINWNEVKKSGISFVIIRCGYRGSSTGAMIEDPKFRANIKGAKAAGLNVGVYFFTQAVNEVEAVEEASMALSLIGGYGVNLPVYLDVEGSGGRGDRIDAGTRTAVCKAFCATIQNSGYKAGIYANKTWLTSYINTSSLSSYKIWLAQYAASPTYTATRYDMWQYSSKGKVPGISGNVDMNIRYN